MRLRRLTRLEYQNTIRDLLGDGILTSVGLAADQQTGDSGFTAGAAITSAADIRTLFDTSLELAGAVQANLGAWAPCTAAPIADERACAAEFIAEFGLKAFRRPLADEEIGRLLALYDVQRGAEVAASFADAIGALSTAILQSPNFLYHWQLGPALPIREGNLIRFNPYEMASRLSYAIWASMPDAALFESAKAGELTTAEQIEQQARRLVADPKAESGLSDFFVQWLNLEPVLYAQKNSELAELFSPAVAESMLLETERFVGSLFVGPSATGRVDDLLTSRVAFVDESLAKIYGVPGVSGSNLTQMTLDPSQRSGMLTQAAFLTRHASEGESHPVRRGVQIVRQLLCQPVPPPVNMMVDDVGPPSPGMTTRQRFAKHSENPCAACHLLFDPLGFAFENYDELGRYRTEDNGQPVDATGSITLSSGVVTFQNAIELTQALSQSAEVRDCVAENWLRFLLRRKQGPGEEVALDLAKQSYESASFDMRELIVALVKTPAFTHRSPSAGEPLP